MRSLAAGVPIQRVLGGHRLPCDQPLVPEQVGARVIGAVPARRGAQRVGAVHVVAGCRDRCDRGPEPLAGAVVGDGLAVPLELVGREMPHAAAHADALRRHPDHGVAEPGAEPCPVHGLVLREADVPVRAHDPGRSEQRLELVRELLEGSLYGLVEGRAVRRPVGLRVVGLEALVERERVTRPAGECHAGTVPRARQGGASAAAAPRALGERQRDQEGGRGEQGRDVQPSCFTGAPGTPQAPSATILAAMPETAPTDPRG